MFKHVLTNGDHCFGLHLTAPEGRGYALAASVRGYWDHLRKLATGRGGDEAIASAMAERARLAREQADHIALKNAVARRELVSAADVETEWSGILRTVRAGMLAVPSRVSQRLPHLTDYDVSEIDREIREVLTELATQKDKSTSIRRCL